MSGSFRLRPALPQDVTAVHRVHTEAIRIGAIGHYTEEVIDVWAGAFNPDNFPRNIVRLAFFVAESERGELDGFLAVDLDTGEVDSVYVAPWAQGKGLGSALLDRAEMLAANHGFSTIWLDASLNAVDFYEHNGWVETRRHSRARQDVEIPLVRMEKSLTV